MTGHSANLDEPACDPACWLLDPEIVYLNHGAFGSCLRAVLEFQQDLRCRMERDPVQFLVRDLETLLDGARHGLAAFVGADPDDLVFVLNATAGINTVLRSLEFKSGDELVVANHEYNASRNALQYVAERCGARVVVAEVPFPLEHAGQIVEAVLSCVTSRTRLVLIDHVTSQTGLVFPLAQIISELNSRGIDSLVDGAHAPGMVPLNLRELGATFYTGNCHKWIGAPKTAAFLHVQRDRQPAIRPLIVSHGANSPRTDRSRFLIEFGWTGTTDPSACLSVSEALRLVGALLPGGWPEIMRRNHALALAARDLLCRALGIAAPCPDDLLGSLAAVPIPDAPDTKPAGPQLFLDGLQEQLFHERRIEVPVIHWPRPPKRLLRISAQLYNSLPQYERMAAALVELLP